MREMSEIDRAARPTPRSRRRYVLDDEPAILHAVAPHQRALARQAATASVLLLEPGCAPLQEWFARPLGGPGLLILHGVLAREVTIVGRTATELLGPGDMLRPWDVRGDEPVPSSVFWLVLTTTQLALLDRTFAERTRPWSPIADAFMMRLARRAQAIAVQRAIASHPRVDMRVAMLLWHLAGRWGRVHHEGEMRLTLPLTHKLLGELVSAERPDRVARPRAAVAGRPPASRGRRLVPARNPRRPRRVRVPTAPAAPCKRAHRGRCRRRAPLIVSHTVDRRGAAAVCLAIPGRIVEHVDEPNQLAKVDVAGVRRTVNIGLLNDVGPGDWVLIHVGFAISQVDEAEAHATLALLQEMGAEYEQELAELQGSSIE